MPLQEKEKVTLTHQVVKHQRATRKAQINKTSTPTCPCEVSQFCALTRGEEGGGAYFFIVTPILITFVVWSYSWGYVNKLIYSLWQGDQGQTKTITKI